MSVRKFTTCLSVLLMGATIPFAGASMAGQTPATAAAQTIATEVTAVLPVKGLTADNGQAIQKAVEGMTVDAYVCPQCKGRRAMAGRCQGCEQDLRLQRMPIARKAMASVDKGTLTVSVVPGEELRLSQLESTLKSQKVVLLRDDLKIVGAPVLEFQGATTLADAQMLQKTLRAANLFEQATAEFDAKSTKTWVTVMSGAMPPTVGVVTVVCEKAEKPLRLTDVVWRAPKAQPVEASSR